MTRDPEHSGITAGLDPLSLLPVDGAADALATTNDERVRRLTEQRDDLQAQCDMLQRRYIDAASRYHWSLAVGTVLARRPPGLLGALAQCLPHGLWRWFQARQLRRRRLFDVGAYRLRYPDTKRSRFGPLAHFLRWGVLDGRDGGPNRPAWRETALPDGGVGRILRSGLFDHGWYCDRYGFDGTPEQAVMHYLQGSAVDPLHDPGPLFSGAHYILQNPDTVSINPLWHYLMAGRGEGRRALSPRAADEFMRNAEDENLTKIEEIIDISKPTLVFSWESGNFFFNDIAEYVREYLISRGCEVQSHRDDAGIDPDTHNLVVVAPHEYCIHGPGRDWPAATLAQAVYVNTEQWHTSWFSLALGVMDLSGKALDLNPASARGLRRLGIQAGFLPIVPSERGTFSFSAAPLSAQVSQYRAIKPLTYPSVFGDRPYDVLYVAALNDRRAGVLADLGQTLSRYDCLIHTPAFTGPVKAGDPNMISTSDCAHLGRNTKILLNIHQGDSKYFEWHRLFLSGIWEGCVVVTEPCIDTGVLRAGVHYLEVEAHQMGEQLDWLLGSQAGREKMAEIHGNCLDLRRRLQEGSLLLA